MNISLESLINEQATLTEEQRASLVSIFGHRARKDTKAKLARMVELPLSLWPNYGIYRRVHIKGDGFSYCAGQDYGEEIALVRNLILGRAK